MRATRFMLRLALAVVPLTGRSAGAAEVPGDPVQTLSIRQGELSVSLRDNSESPKILSGIQSLFHRRDSPGFDAYDTDHNFKLNLWSYDYPRFTQPFYYGRAAHGMVLILMFDRSHDRTDEIRFSLFKFKVPRHPRPAWDFQYLIHKVEQNKDYLGSTSKPSSRSRCNL